MWPPGPGEQLCCQPLHSGTMRLAGLANVFRHASVENVFADQHATTSQASYYLALLEQPLSLMRVRRNLQFYQGVEQLCYSVKISTNPHKAQIVTPAPCTPEQLLLRKRECSSLSGAVIRKLLSERRRDSGSIAPLPESQGCCSTGPLQGRPCRKIACCCCPS